MVKQLESNKKIEELFNTIENSIEYKKYKEINKTLENNPKIKELVNTIKRLQQKSVKLEEKKDNSYKEIDKQIEEKVKELNSIPIYQEYIKRMNELNYILTESSSNIEKYINSKI